MQLEHERPVEREFGPNSSLLRRRILGAILICLVLGFLLGVVVMFGSDSPNAMFSAAKDEANSEGPSVWLFLLGATGMATVALVIPWLSALQGKATGNPDSEASGLPAPSSPLVLPESRE